MPRRWATFLDSSAMTEWHHRWDRMWVCLNTSPWDALLIVFLLLRLNLRQRKHPTPWEPEEQHVFLCNSKWWWGAEITHVSPGFPTFLLKFGTSDKEAGLIFFQALKCWAKFFFMKLRFSLMTAQFPKSGCQHVTTSTWGPNWFCIELFSPKPPKQVNEAESTCKWEKPGERRGKL